MSEWERVCLDKLGFVSRGRSKHRPRNAPELYGGKYPFVQTSDIKNSGLYLTKYEQTYNDKGLAQSKLWPKGTLCITIAANIADTAILGIDACFPDSVIGFLPDENKCDVRYIKYFFDCGFQAALKNFSQGAAQDNLSQEKLLSVPLHIPPLATQRRIASVLSNYDSAIANCRRQIVLLEEAAMRLYKEWFKEGKGEKKKIGEVCECVLGGTPNRAKPEYWGGNVAWINSGKVNELRIVEPSEYITELGLRKSAAKMMPRHTTVLAITGATLGQVSLLEIDSAANQSVVGVLENENLHYEFIYPLIVDNIRKLIMHQTGGAQQHICKDDVLNFEVHIPNKGELKKYGELARPMFEQISELFFTIRTLTEARDRLLPKLMKGEIAV